jgi:site-specific DNA-methyltransferase (adenine-specific)
MQGMLFTEEEKEAKPRRKSKLARKTSQPTGNVGPFLLDQIYAQDCVGAMSELESDSIDIAIADPPYNLSKGGAWKWDNSVRLPGFGGDWSKVMAEWDDMPLAEYFAFTLKWLSELKRVVKPTGSIWLHGTYHNIGIINFALQLLEVEIINEVVWYKRNSFPNLSGRRLTASHETIIWAHTGGQKRREYFFNYDAAKEMTCPEDGLKEAGKQMRTVWDIPNNKKREEIQHGKHPTQKPLRLLDRMLQLSASKGDVLLVPFGGAGSECVAAKQLGIHFIGFEIDPEFVNICNARLGLADSTQNSKSQPATPDHIDRATSIKSLLHSARKSKTIPSLIKWTGSKRSQATTIAELMPPYRRYFEPFLGGGAMLYLAAVEDSVASDIYSPLIELWKMVQADPDAVISNYEEQWQSLQSNLDAIDLRELKRGDGVPEYYYQVRSRFNKSPEPLDLNFLMRTCVNGIVRFNDEGGFNNSFHLSRRGMTPQRFSGVVRSWHEVIQGVSFRCQDYAAAVADTQKDDFVYFDPPYAGNRQRYVEDLDLDRFFGTLESLNSKDVKWALSFDGKRGETDLTHDVPKTLFRRQLFLSSGNSAVNKVLNGPVEKVEESLYLNY